jgi:hypothetical protein
VTSFVAYSSQEESTLRLPAPAARTSEDHGVKPGRGDVVNGERFELARLLQYDEPSLIAELRRVATLVSGSRITRAEFDRLSRAAASTYVRRFGSWRAALEAAGLGDRYSGQQVTQKMRGKPARYASREEIIEELQRLALTLNRTPRLSDIPANSDLIGTKVVRNRFGSWGAALQAAGLTISPHGRRWSDDDYYENLLAVWTHHGREPTFSEMDKPPSRITSGGYESRFGTWGLAKQAFVDRVNAELDEYGEPRPAIPTHPQPLHPTPGTPPEERRTPSVGLRYRVLQRDRFRCVTCGRSPATELGCTLQVDHLVPVSKGGKTHPDNLRSLCEACNLGRGNRFPD